MNEQVSKKMNNLCSAINDLIVDEELVLWMSNHLGVRAKLKEVRFRYLRLALYASGIKPPMVVNLPDKEEQ